MALSSDANALKFVKLNGSTYITLGFLCAAVFGKPRSV